MECRKRLEDAMTTDASTATRVKATRERQADRIKRVRFSDQEHSDSKSEGDTEMQSGGQEASVARKRPAEAGAEGAWKREPQRRQRSILTNVSL